MKILTFTTLFPNKMMPQHGLFVQKRVSALAKDHEVVVIAPVPYFPKLNINKKWFRFSQVPFEETIDGVKVYHPRYFLIPKIGRMFYGLFMFLSLYGFVKKMKQKYDFNLIDAHFIYPDGYAASLLGRYLKTQVVLNARGSDINWYPQFYFIRRCIQKALARASSVIAVSENIKNEIVKLGVKGQKVHVVPNGIDSKIFAAIPKKDARESLKLAGNRKIVLSVGHLYEAKGFQLLVTALDLIEREDIDLYLIGEGQYKASLTQLIDNLELQKRVKVLPEMTQQELCRWYNAADLFALTSFREGRPNVVLEALACGTPVVSMDNWGLPEIVGTDKGILLNSYDPERIANTIESALERSWDKEAISSAMKSFSWQKTANDVADLFKNVLESEDVLFFSSDDWNSGLKTSKYHLSTRLARNHRVFFINSLSLRAPTFSKRDLSKIVNKLKSCFRGVKEVRNNLFVYTPLLIPFQRFKWIRFLNQKFLIWQFKFIMWKYDFENPYIWTFLPNTLDVVTKLPKKRLIYYCVDDMSAFKGVAQDVIKEQDVALTKEADMAFTVSNELFEQKRQVNDRTYYSPHGVDFELFHQAVSKESIPLPDDLKGIKNPVIGFYGLISPDWVDYELVKFLSQKHPNWSFVFIGKIDSLQGIKPPEAQNIHYLSVKPYEDLYKYSHYFGVAFLPFNVNQLTVHSHPLKILEFLSAGRTVVSVDIPEVKKYKDVIEIASDYEDFSKKLEKCIRNDSQTQKDKRIKFASENSWEKRYETIQQIITDSL